MKTAMITAAAFLTLSVAAFAQTNATSAGTATTAGNSAGAPSASTPAGQIATTGAVTAAPPGVSAMQTPGMPAPAPTADSKVTGTTTAPK